MDTLYRDLLMSQELDASKKELEVAHASLTRDFDHLELANKLVKGEIIKLRDNLDILQATYEEALVTLNDPIIVEYCLCF
jgi:hypothetical protein